MCSVLATQLAVGAAPSATALRNFADLTIEELMNESVTSVSKKETRLNESPAAITVVTQDDIRRFGATTIAEALRFVPGLDVARLNANQWAISSRGFNFLYANKLLVLMDGRTLYTPTFGGVHWNVVDTAMEDIDQIEVIRGPGATLWGANAVNGVINIMTRSARETQGTLVSTSAGTEDRFAATIRHGGRAGENVFYRAYAKYYDRRGQVDPVGDDTGDEWHGFKGGARFDWSGTPENAFTLQSDYHHGRTDENLREVRFTPPFTHAERITNRNHGVNVLGRWTHIFSPASELSVQSYYDHSLHSDGKTVETRDTADLEVQHRFAWRGRHDIVWGFGYRYNRDEVPPSPIVIWTPESTKTQLATAFVQDQIALTPERLSLIVGSKFERTGSTAIKSQPGVRLLWTPSRTQTAWAAVSRAFKTPARFDTDARLNRAAFQPGPMSPVIEVALIGNPKVKVEELRAYELGYRLEPSRRWSIDVAAFYNDYRDLIGYAAGDMQFETSPTPHLLLPLIGNNELAGHTFGTEVAVQWQATERWRLIADYSWLKVKVRPDPSLEGDSPQHQAHLRSYLKLGRKWELNAAAGYVGALLNSVTLQPIPAYVRCDVGLVWRPSKTVEAGLWGENLTDPQHQEFSGPNAAIQTQIRRSITAKVTWRY